MMGNPSAEMQAIRIAEHGAVAVMKNLTIPIPVPAESIKNT